MKVSLGITLREGPWGGGNQFATSLASYLKAHGCEVSYDLSDPYLDIILLFDPRTSSQSASYKDDDILHYLREINSQALVVHRVNECDERKGTTNVNQRLIEANKCADYTVFVSTWLQDLFLKQGMACQLYTVILNGSDTTVFNPNSYQRWNKVEPLRLVTHHWGANWLKGFDIYQRLDELLVQDEFRRRFEFTYIGNIPSDVHFLNTKYISPLSGVALASALRVNHVYLTASQYEPGGNHQNEGANCGLPLLYRESGCLPEYCVNFGIAFDEHNFEDKLNMMVETYDHWVERMPNYPRKIENTVSSYLHLFEELLNQRRQLIAKRSQQSRQTSFSRIIKTKMRIIRNHTRSRLSTWIRGLVK
jgi:hypothetical protein